MSFALVVFSIGKKCQLDLMGTVPFLTICGVNVKSALFDVHLRVNVNMYAWILKHIHCSTKNLTLGKPNTSESWTIGAVRRRFGLDRFDCITIFYSKIPSPWYCSWNLWRGHTEQKYCHQLIIICWDFCLMLHLVIIFLLHVSIPVLKTSWQHYCP